MLLHLKINIELVILFRGGKEGFLIKSSFKIHTLNVSMIILTLKFISMKIIFLCLGKNRKVMLIFCTSKFQLFIVLKTAITDDVDFL